MWFIKTGVMNSCYQRKSWMKIRVLDNSNVTELSFQNYMIME